MPTTEGHGDLQSHFVTNVTRRSSHLNNLLDPAQECRLHNPITFRSLDSFRRSWHPVIPTIRDTIPDNSLLQGHATGWHSIVKSLQ